MKRREFVVAVTGLLASACGTTGGSGDSGGSRNRITREQLEQSNVQTAYEAVQRLRPRWLRGRVGSEDPVVHLDGVRMNGLSDLRTIAVTSVEHIVFRSANDATTLYGTGYTGGVIEVSTRGNTGGG